MVDGREEEGGSGEVWEEKLLVLVSALVLLCHTRYTTEMR
jgi:hypothetical protein